jgi:hypothetical protein
MNINFMGRRAGADQDDSQYDVYEADAERLYDSFSELYDDFDEGRSKTPFVIIGALLAVAIVGGGLAFAYKRGSGDGGDGVAVVSADQTPTKVELTDPGGIDIPFQGREVFNEVAGEGGGDGEAGTEAAEVPSAPGAGAGTAEGGVVQIPGRELGRAGLATGANGASGADEETGATDGADGELTIGALASRVTRDLPGPLVPAVESSDDDQARAIPESSDPTGRPAAAVSLPEQSVQQPAASAPAAATPAERLALQPAGPETGVFQPRRVQTVTIGPDGSVVSEQAPAPAGLEGAGAEARELARLIDPGAGEAPSAVVPEPAAEPEPVAADPVGGTLRAGAERLNPPLREDAQETLFAPSPRPKPRPTARLASVQPGAAERPQIPASATNAAAARALEGFAVQVASHRKQAEAVAAFADLQQRFPSLISGYQPLIQRADLGERGIFFRLRIGPVATKSDADRLCDSLKGAGLPACLVRAL